MVLYAGVMDNNLERPKESALIEKARKRLYPPVSMAKAASMSGLSRSRYSNIEKGFRWIAKGIQKPDVIPADTLARVADALEISPAELRAADRPDAAQIREQSIRFYQQRDRDVVNLHEVSTSDLLAEVRRRIDDPDNEALVARRVDPQDRSSFTEE